MQPIAESELIDDGAATIAFAALLRSGHEAWADAVEAAPYLEGVPQLSDDLARLAAQRRLTPAEEQRIEAEVERICKLIRTARLQWETNRADAVPCL